jgi:SPP1 family predicted phage head-tail adaptor
MIKLNHPTYNDGLLEYGSTVATYNAKREKTGETWSKKGSLYFEQMSIRDSDIILASQMGYKVDIKLKTQIRPLSNLDKVKIGSTYYEIKSMDEDARHLYLYLQRVGA